MGLLITIIPSLPSGAPQSSRPQLEKVPRQKTARKLFPNKCWALSFQWMQADVADIDKGSPFKLIGRTIKAYHANKSREMPFALCETASWTWGCPQQAPAVLALRNGVPTGSSCTAFLLG